MQGWVKICNGKATRSMLGLDIAPDISGFNGEVAIYPVEPPPPELIARIGDGEFYKVRLCGTNIGAVVQVEHDTRRAIAFLDGRPSTEWCGGEKQPREVYIAEEYAKCAVREWLGLPYINSRGMGLMRCK